MQRKREQLSAIDRLVIDALEALYTDATHEVSEEIDNEIIAIYQSTKAKQKTSTYIDTLQIMAFTCYSINKYSSALQLAEFIIAKNISTRANTFDMWVIRIATNVKYMPYNSGPVNEFIALLDSSYFTLQDIRPLTKNRFYKCLIELITIEQFPQATQLLAGFVNLPGPNDNDASMNDCLVTLMRAYSKTKLAREDFLLPMTVFQWEKLLESNRYYIAFLFFGITVALTNDKVSKDQLKKNFNAKIKVIAKTGDAATLTDKINVLHETLSSAAENLLNEDPKSEMGKFFSNSAKTLSFGRTQIRTLFKKQDAGLMLLDLYNNLPPINPYKEIETEEKRGFGLTR